MEDQNEKTNENTQNQNDKIVELNTEETEQVVGGRSQPAQPLRREVPGGGSLRTLV